MHEDMFTRAVHPAKDKREAADSEGVELGTINSSGSIGLSEDSWGQALQFLGQTAQAANQGVTSGSNSAPSQPQAQPVSFQSLSALASQASRRWKGSQDAAGVATTDAANAVGTSAAEHADSAQRAQGNPDFAGTEQITASDRTVVSSGPDTQQSSHFHPAGSGAQSFVPSAGGNASTDNAGADVGSSRGRPLAAVNLGKASSMEKKWGYPAPTGSPMFERLRSRNSSQEEEVFAAPSAEPSAASSTNDEQRSAQNDERQSAQYAGHASAADVSQKLGETDNQEPLDR